MRRSVWWQQGVHLFRRSHEWFGAIPGLASYTPRTAHTASTGPGWPATWRRWWCCSSQAWPPAPPPQLGSGSSCFVSCCPSSPRSHPRAMATLPSYIFIRFLLGLCAENQAPRRGPQQWQWGAVHQLYAYISKLHMNPTPRMVSSHVVNPLFCASPSRFVYTAACCAKDDALARCPKTLLLPKC